MSDGLRHCGVPLGGLGTGSVELRSDGFFHEWQIMNNAPWGAGAAVELPPDTAYFGMQVDEHSVLLGRTTDYCHNLNDPYHLLFLEHAEAIEAEARVPFTNLSYRYPDLPVEVSLEAFSPFIPLDEKNSGLPLAFFTITVSNRTTRRVRAAVFMAQRNLVGYTERGNQSLMESAEADGCARITFSRAGLEEGCSSRGSMAVGAWADGPATFSHVLHPRSNRDVWEPLRSQGRLEDADWSEVKTWDHVPGGSGLPFGVLCCSRRAGAARHAAGHVRTGLALPADVGAPLPAQEAARPPHRTPLRPLVRRRGRRAGLRRREPCDAQARVPALRRRLLSPAR